MEGTGIWSVKGFQIVKLGALPIQCSDTFAVGYVGLYRLANTLCHRQMDGQVDMPVQSVKNAV